MEAFFKPRKYGRRPRRQEGVGTGTEARIHIPRTEVAAAQTNWDEPSYHRRTMLGVDVHSAC